MNHIALLDNGAYVRPGPDVITQLRRKLPAGWQATVLARDGDVTSGVADQLENLPASATHLVVSVGGNDALQHQGGLAERICFVAEALQKLRAIQVEFSRKYRSMLRAVLHCGKPTVVCTIYDGCHPDPREQQVKVAALALFNDCIIGAAIEWGLPVLDLRAICTQAADYANPIEPGVAGGEKMAAAVISLVQRHDFTGKSSAIYQGETRAASL
jgi:GDSL-like Lipase/Acylhydrolase family